MAAACIASGLYLFDALPLPDWSRGLADTLGLSISMMVGAIGWGLLALLWTAALFKTLAGVASGALFKNG